MCYDLHVYDAYGEQSHTESYERQYNYIVWRICVGTWVLEIQNTLIFCVADVVYEAWLSS